MQVFKVGTYKSAVEPFIATEMSPANREQVTTFIHFYLGAGYGRGIYFTQYFCRLTECLCRSHAHVLSGRREYKMRIG